MSIFNELLPPLFEISNLCTKNFSRDLKDALESLDKFEEEFQSQNGRSKTREKTQKDKNAMITLQSIDESEDEPKKLSDPRTKRSTSETRSDSQISIDKQKPKKRSKNEVDDMSSPEQDKRVKRNASAKAQSIISKQVNINLTQKLRRENSIDKSGSVRPSSRSRRKDEEKENFAPQETPIQIKQEKISIASEPEPMETEALALTELEIKQERHKDDVAMPPPAAPVPKPRKVLPKDKSQEKPQEEEETSRRSRRATRNKKPADSAAPAAPAPRGLEPEEAGPVPEARPKRTRGRKKLSELRTDSGNSTQLSTESLPAPAKPGNGPASQALEPEETAAVPEARPKRTRGRKKLSELRTDSGNSTQLSTESLPASPADKPRPKRTRRGQKADKDEPKPVKPEPAEPKPLEPEPTISPKEERSSVEQNISSPVLQQKEIKPKNKKEKAADDLAKTKLTKTNSADKVLANTENVDQDLANSKSTELTKTKKDKNLADTKHKINGLIGKSVETLITSSMDQVDNIALDETRIISKTTNMDQTVILPNGVYNHAPETPKNIQMNETVVLDKTMILNKANTIMDATVVLERCPIPSNLNEKNSLLTDDDSDAEDIPNTPPQHGVPETQPLSAVKEKVQQFEEMATRVTRTKTRAMAKKEEDNSENQTPPDKASKAILSSDTLNKMNSLIFNGKPPQISSSACKPRANIPTIPSKLVTSSASKAAAISRAREAAEETMKREDARRKKEALLEAKRDQQKRKREEKMAAAAAARSLAERERRALLEAAARERVEKQQHAEHERVERLKEAERKRYDLARKVAETEERRRAEEVARQQRLAEDQRRAAEQRNKKNEELEAMRREEARMAKEIEKKQREYIEKQKKQKTDKMHTPFKTPHTPLGKYHTPLPPVYMEDGFQYLNSDEDAEPPERPVPAWSTSKARRHRLAVQKRLRKQLVDEWFRVGVYSPDLGEIFPSMERARLKRTSSAVWHTPPPLPPIRD